MLSTRAWVVLMAYAKVYNLKTCVRATDRLRRIDGGLPIRHRHVQSILEHSALAAKLVEFICLAYGKMLADAGEVVDPIWASFLAGHHDDAEWKTGDVVPELGFNGFTREGKVLAEHDAMSDLLGLERNFLWTAYEEYELRETAEAKLVKLADILELFCHNRVLLNFGLGIISYGDYREYAPETYEESLEFLSKSLTGTTSIAEILEGRYAVRFRAMGFPAVYQEIFDEMTEAVRIFPFADYVSIVL